MSKISPPWVPKGLRKTVGGQHVGLEPLYCESKGASDYCMHCSADMGYFGTPRKPCNALEKLRLAMIPDDQVLAFGCDYEADDVLHEPGLPGEPCKKWCKRPTCPVSLKPLPPTAAELEYASWGTDSHVPVQPLGGA